jgi:GR25 family glycosyltransferase involved in LPS biosynthesis
MKSVLQQIDIKVTRISTKASDHMRLDGYYINLDSATERREALEKHMAEMKFSDRISIRRFPAIRPSPQEIEDFKVHLPGFSPGFVGALRSHTAVVQQKIVNNDGDSDLLVIEDDTQFSPRTEFFLDQAFEWLKGREWDLFYTDFIVDTQSDKVALYSIRRRFRAKEQQMIMLDLKNFSFTGQSCYVVNRNSLHKYKAILEELNPVNKLPDWHILEMVHAGRLSAVSIFPFITTVNAEADFSCTDGGIPLSHFHNFIRRHLWIDAPPCM